jgi:hypothetical protein
MVDSPAGDFGYDRHGHGYAGHRADPRIATCVHRALGAARTVLNVGAGAGSYEPADRRVLAVEPSPVMRAQRPPHLLPAVDAKAERPERFLDPAVRRAQSAWEFVSPAAQERAITTLRADLDGPKWDEMYHDLRTRPQFDGALRVVVGQPAG